VDLKTRLVCWKTGELGVLRMVQANELGPDMNFPSNILYAANLKSAARLLGEPKWAQEAQRWESTMRKVACRDGRFVGYAVCNKQGGDGGDESRRLFPTNVFVGKLIRLELLIRHGELTAARRELLRSYLPMAKSTGTLWALFEKSVSCNHGFTVNIAVLIDQLEKGEINYERR